jgi:hypothetical protein
MSGFKFHTNFPPCGFVIQSCPSRELALIVRMSVAARLQMAKKPPCARSTQQRGNIIPKPWRNIRQANDNEYREGYFTPAGVPTSLPSRRVIEPQYICNKKTGRRNGRGACRMYVQMEDSRLKSK